MSAFRIVGVSLEIARAQRIAAADSTPAHCLVEGTYGIGFAIALPDTWNHDFLMQGGGLNGSVRPPVGGTASGSMSGLARGFAVASTDTGQKGKGGFDRSFMSDQQAVLDFDYQAIVRVAEVAKQIIATYYGRATAHSYYVGCSTGGREGMIMTQRYPFYFDGLVSGDPAIRTGLSTSDPWFSPLDTLDYYEKMAAANGGMTAVARWSRLYFVPGMGHCSGGAATLDKFDMLSAVVDWVEKGTAPDFVVATGKAFPNRSRPLCAYPKFAHYKGAGDLEGAKNFDCRN